MKTVVINFSKCKYPMDLHHEIKEKLEAAGATVEVK